MNCHFALFLHQFYFHSLYEEYLITQRVWERSAGSMFEVMLCEMQEIDNTVMSYSS